MRWLRYSLPLWFVALVSFLSATCSLSTTSPSVNICAPINGSTVTSPVQVSASANDTAHPVVAMKAYLDYNAVAVASSTANQLSTTLSTAAGSHHLTVTAWDSSGASFKTSINFSVSSATTASVSVSPANVAFGTQVVGTASSPQSVTLSNGTASAISVSAPSITGDFLISSNSCGTSLAAGSSCVVQVEFKPTATGTRTGTLTISDSPDNASPHQIGLSGSGVTATSCTPSTVNPSVTVCAPLNGATVTSPFQVIAETTDSHTVTAMKVYIDNVSVYTANANQISTTLTASAGAHSLVVNAWDSTGAVFKSSALTFTVSSNSTPPPVGTTSVLTFHNDKLRTGANTNETILTPANVNVNQFGKKFAVTLDGRVYASPLYLPGLTIGGATHNVVFVATEHDSVYAFDADGLSSTALWHKNLLPSGSTTIPQANVGSTIYPEVGITGTPVIDASSGTLYVVAASIDSGVYNWRLHALDVISGAEKFGGPVIVNATGFNTAYQLQRTGLLLANGNVYFSFGSEGDHSTWHGWVFGYNAGTLAKVAAYNDTPTGNGGGIWQGGGGLGADAGGNLYFATGNGSNNIATGGSNLADSFVKLNASGQVADYFVPYNHANLDCCDLDMASGGPLLLPDQSGSFPHIMVGGGKSGTLYVINRDNMGKFSSAGNNILQTISGAAGAIYSQPAYWNGEVYLAASSDVPKAFSVSNGVLSTTAAMKASTTFPFPGANVAISANGSSNGILWAQQWSSTSASILHAYDAASMKELWNSSMNATRDSLGTGDKFMLPVVVNGKVYIGNKSQLIVYGLLQ